MTLPHPAPTSSASRPTTRRTQPASAPYAYNDLGWRTVATVADDTALRLGNGRRLRRGVLRRRWPCCRPPVDDARSADSDIDEPASPSVDGVYLGGTITPWLTSSSATQAGTPTSRGGSLPTQSPIRPEVVALHRARRRRPACRSNRRTPSGLRGSVRARPSRPSPARGRLSPSRSLSQRRRGCLEALEHSKARRGRSS